MLALSSSLLYRHCNSIPSLRKLPGGKRAGQKEERIKIHQHPLKPLRKKSKLDTMMCECNYLPFFVARVLFSGCHAIGFSFLSCCASCWGENKKAERNIKSHRLLETRDFITLQAGLEQPLAVGGLTAFNFPCCHLSDSLI